ncbi:MAG TPA: DUF1987 domain-containing protein [Cyclobacteriaceae bacterium]
MKDLYIKPTKTTPEIIFESEKSFLRISGVSMPEHTPSFYEPVYGILECYNDYDGRQLTLNIALSHFNTSSSKILFDILKRVKKLNSKHDISVVWFYEEDDEDMEEIIEDFREVIEININAMIAEKLD